MSRHPIIRSKAKLDIAEAALWYASKRDGLGKEFLEAVQGRIESVCALPQSFAVVARKVIRRALVDRFPYAIYFVEQSEGVVILAVFHTSRDHRRLLRRRH